MSRDRVGVETKHTAARKGLQILRFSVISTTRKLKPGTWLGIILEKEMSSNELIQYLNVLGYNTFRLMPDLTSICKAVERRNMDNLQKKKVIKTN